MNLIPKPTVLITGASTGIGAACAIELDRRGWHVFAGVRREEDAKALQDKASERLTPVMLDVTIPEQITQAIQTIETTVGDQGLNGLVNNAGIAIGGPLEAVSDELLRKQLDVNVFGAIAVTRTAMPLLRRGQGRIVMMGSISGRIAVPFLSPYAMSKFALEALSDSLRNEVYRWGLRVSLVEP
ncbi:MAG: SDR family NAD(P)-dependent oxidoreductase, partial [Planctomycetia bacterium]